MYVWTRDYITVAYITPGDEQSPPTDSRRMDRSGWGTTRTPLGVHLKIRSYGVTRRDVMPKYLAVYVRLGKLLEAIYQRLPNPMHRIVAHI